MEPIVAIGGNTIHGALHLAMQCQVMASSCQVMPLVKHFSRFNYYYFLKLLYRQVADNALQSAE
jgi:hypothetical protein